MEEKIITLDEIEFEKQRLQLELMRIELKKREIMFKNLCEVMGKKL